jgi:hypothetical protein
LVPSFGPEFGLLLTLAPEIAISASARDTRHSERERERDGERQQEHEGFFAIAAETREFSQGDSYLLLGFVRNKQLRSFLSSVAAERVI